MGEPGIPVEAPTVSCEICRKEIPKSKSKYKNLETEDYVFHFCGTACYQE